MFLYLSFELGTHIPAYMRYMKNLLVVVFILMFTECPSSKFRVPFSDVCYHLNICFNIYFLNLSLSFIHVGIELMFIGVMDLIVGLQILIATMNSVHQVMIQKLLLFALFFNYSPFLSLLFILLVFLNSILYSRLYFLCIL
jgi:hypothetical protein